MNHTVMIIVAVAGLALWPAYVGAFALPTHHMSLPSTDTLARDAIRVIMLEPDSLLANDDTDTLARDAIYVGSMTFAGLVLFGSTLLTRIYGVTRSDTRIRRLAFIVVVVGLLSLAFVHIWFATTCCVGDYAHTLVQVGYLSIILSVVVIGGYVLLATSQPSSSTLEQM